MATGSYSQIAPQLVEEGTDLREAMRIIDSSGIKLVVVTGADGRLMRTVTDGDIRRGLLAGLDLTSRVTDLGGRAPVSCPAGMDDADIARVMDHEGVSAAVIVDEAGVPVDIVDRARSSGMTFMSPPHIGSEELSFVHAAFDDNWIAPAGPNVAAFEHRLAEVSARSHALAVTSGTAALHLALRCLRVAAGDRVYVSDLTFAASVQPILYEQAVPVLIDSEPDGWNMSPAALARRLEQDAASDTLPKAIIVVHIYGQSADLDAIQPIAERFGIPVIEDAAESLGATWANRPSGSHGILSAFSFNGNKIITTSGGGALVSDDQTLIDRARYLSTQGRDPTDHYQHSSIAYNYRLSNVLAGIGIGQLELLRERVEARRAIFRRYVEGLRDIAGVYFQQDLPGGMGNRWLTVVGFDPDSVALHPFRVMRELRQLGIETRPGWKPMHLQPLCASHQFEPHDENAPVSERLFFQTLCLPSGSALGGAEQDRIIGQLRRILDRD